MIAENVHGDRLLEILRVEESELGAYQPLTHALVIASHGERTLLVFNQRKNHWELAGGKIDPGESPRQCAARELREESGQICEELELVGVMHFLLRPNQHHALPRTEFGALYRARIEQPLPFVENDETARIEWWDGVREIGAIDEIDAKLATLAP